MPFLFSSSKNKENEKGSGKNKNFGKITREGGNVGGEGRLSVAAGAGRAFAREGTGRHAASASSTRREEGGHVPAENKKRKRDVPLFLMDGQACRSAQGPHMFGGGKRTAAFPPGGCGVRGRLRDPARQHGGKSAFLHSGEPLPRAGRATDLFQDGSPYL